MNRPSGVMEPGISRASVLRPGRETSENVDASKRYMSPPPLRSEWNTMKLSPPAASEALPRGKGPIGCGSDSQVQSHEPVSKTTHCRAVIIELHNRTIAERPV